MNPLFTITKASETATSLYKVSKIENKEFLSEVSSNQYRLIWRP